jgi:hypothetical protein
MIVCVLSVSLSDSLGTKNNIKKPKPLTRKKPKKTITTTKKTFYIRTVFLIKQFNRFLATRHYNFRSTTFPQKEIRNKHTREVILL